MQHPDPRQNFWKISSDAGRSIEIPEKIISITPINRGLGIPCRSDDSIQVGRRPIRVERLHRNPDEMSFQSKKPKLFAVPLEEFDDPELFKVFLDLETDIDEQARTARVDVAKHLGARLLGRGVQSFEREFLREAETFIGQLTSDDKVRKRPWRELAGVTCLRSLELGDLNAAARIISLSKNYGGETSSLLAGEFLLMNRLGSPLKVLETSFEVQENPQWLALFISRLTNGNQSAPPNSLGADYQHFYTLLNQFGQTQSPFEIVKWAFRRGEQLKDAYVKTLAYLFLIACGLNSNHARLQVPRNIRRHGLEPEHLHPQIQILLVLAAQIEKLDEQDATRNFLAEVQLIEALCESLLDLHEYLIIVMGLRVICSRNKHGWYANLLQQKYERFSRGHSGDATEDLLGILVFEEISAKSKPGSVLSMGGQLASKWIAMRTKTIFSSSERIDQQKQEFFNYCAELLQKNIRHEGGLFQKIFQLSSGISGAIPDQIRDVLANACVESTPMPTGQLEKIIDGSSAEIFREIQELPFACGSIAQLHKTTIAGQPAVIKIKRLGIEKRIEQDFVALKKWVRIGESIIPGVTLKDVLADWKQRLLLECDLNHELKAHLIAEKVLQGEALKVPGTYPLLSNEKYFVQEFIDGSSFDEYLHRSNQEQRDRVAADIMAGYLKLNTSGVFYLDIHRGNFLFRAEEVFLIDFGGVLLSQEVDNGPDYHQIVYAIERKEWSRVKDLFVQFGIITDPSEEEFRILLEMHKNFLLWPFLIGERFRFTPQFSAELVACQFKASRKIGRMKFPRGANQGSLRFFWSLYSLFSELKAEANWREILDRYADKLERAG